MQRVDLFTRSGLCTTCRTFQHYQEIMARINVIIYTVSAIVS